MEVLNILSDQWNAVSDKGRIEGVIVPYLETPREYEQLSISERNIYLRFNSLDSNEPISFQFLRQGKDNREQ